MTDPVSRRTVLTAGGLAAALALSGCRLPGSDESGEPGGNVYVENASNTEKVVELLVAPQDDTAADSLDTGDAVLQGAYRVPESHALRFAGVLDAGQRYAVRAAHPDSPPSNRVATGIEPCEDTEGGRTVTVTTRQDGVGVVPIDCGESYSENDLEYVDGSEYRNGDVEGTVAPPPDAGNATEDDEGSEGGEEPGENN